MQAEIRLVVTADVTIHHCSFAASTVSTKCWSVNAPISIQRAAVANVTIQQLKLAVMEKLISNV